MKVKVYIEYIEEFDGVLKIKNDDEWSMLDIISENSLHAIPKSRITKVEIIDDKEV